MKRGIGILACAAVTFASVAYAQPGPSPAEAQKGKRIYAEGRVQFDLGHFDRAIELFEEAYRLKPDAAFLFNIAQAHRLAGNTSRALFFYRSYLRNRPDAPNRANVETHISQCEQTLEEERQRQAFKPAPTPSNDVAAAPAVTAEPPPQSAPTIETSVVAPALADDQPWLQFEASAGAALWAGGGPTGGGTGMIGNVAIGLTPAWARWDYLRLAFSARAGVWTAPDSDKRLLFLPLLLEPSGVVPLGRGLGAVFGVGMGLNVMPSLNKDSSLVDPEAKRVVGTLSALEVRPFAGGEYEISRQTAVRFTVAYAYDGKLDRWFRSDSLQRVELALAAVMRL